MTIDDRLAVQAAEEHLRRLRSGELFSDIGVELDGNVWNVPDTSRAEDAIAHLVDLVRRLSPPATPATLAIAA